MNDMDELATNVSWEEECPRHFEFRSTSFFLMYERCA